MRYEEMIYSVLNWAVIPDDKCDQGENKSHGNYEITVE